MSLKYLILAASAFTFAACSGATDDVKKAASNTAGAAKDVASNAANTADTMAGGAKSAVLSAGNKAKLTSVLAQQNDKAKARYDARHPGKTLAFFDIEPGMKVAEALPGGGWYSKILIPYLGDEGQLTGVDYSIAMWPEFGGFATPEFIEKKKSWPTEWVAGTQEWRSGSNAAIDAFTFGTRDTAQDGTYDAVLFIRALHNLSRFESKGGYMTDAIVDANALLKPGGIVGVVQHSGPETNPDEWATGSNGYLKQSNVIAAFEAGGFELVGESDINANPKDVPSEADSVWRLPPSLRGAKDNPELSEKMKAIGESNRMTLKFRKL